MESTSHMSSAFCEYKFPHRCASIRLVTVSRRHAISRSNMVDDIIRYIKTLLTRQCFPRVHRRESDIACNSVCFWVTQHCRDVDGIHSGSVYVHKRYSSLKGEALISLGNKARMFERIHIERNLPSYITFMKIYYILSNFNFFFLS